MTLRSYLILMTIATAVCWAAFGYIIWTVDPRATNRIGFLLFYSSLFLSMVGTTAIIGFIIRFVGLKRKLVFNLVKDAFRQSFLFSFFIITILFLISKDLFSWMNLGFLVIGLTVLELFLLSYNNRGV